MCTFEHLNNFRTEKLHTTKHVYFLLSKSREKYFFSCFIQYLNYSNWMRIVYEKQTVRKDEGMVAWVMNGAG